MKTAKLLKIAFVLAAIFTLSACEDEEIKVETKTGESQGEVIDLD